MMSISAKSPRLFLVPSLRSFSRLLAPFRLLVLGLLVLTAGCASDKEEYVEKPVEELYNDAFKLLNDESYTKAAKAFDEVERQHPYSSWATRAQLMSAYSYYQGNQFDDALVGLDRYIQLHPSNKDVGYAYYLKALCYYEQIADVGRDQATTAQALHALNDVVNRFPNTKYARDAKLKIDLANDHLAGKEMDVGRSYERSKNYLAAIGRYRRVVDDFQTTSHVPEALERLAECYTALGMHDEARKVTAVLGYNYQSSEWYKSGYTLLQPAEEPSRKSFWGDFLTW